MISLCLPQGSVYQKTNAMSEIKRVNKDNFWAKAEVSEHMPWNTKCLDLAGDYSPYAYSLSGNWGVLPGIRDLKLREVQCLGVLREEGLSLEGEGAPLSHVNLAQGCGSGLRGKGLGCTLALLANSWAESQLPENSSWVRKLVFDLSKGCSLFLSLSH